MITEDSKLNDFHSATPIENSLGPRSAQEGLPHPLLAQRDDCRTCGKVEGEGRNVGENLETFLHCTHHVQCIV